MCIPAVREYKCSCGETRLDDEWFEDPIDAVTGKLATADSTLIYFGMYPQTKLVDTSSVTISSTPSLSGLNYEYYLGSDNHYYAKVNSDYFYVEPIKWENISNSYNNTENTLFISKDIIVGGVYYYQDNANRTIDEKTIYPNNYEKSEVREYINSNFLNTAFSLNQKNQIQTTLVKNDVTNSRDQSGYFTEATQYSCDDTSDKVFMLSARELYSTTYGFTSSIGALDKRAKKVTDYAVANGAYKDESSGNGKWWTRSPNAGGTSFARVVNSDGSCNQYAPQETNVKKTDIGIVPAITLSF